jgi:hypothetical protein
MRNILILAALLFATTAYAAPPADHDGSGTETFTLDWSTMVTETNPSSARHRITDGTTAGSWVSWSDPWADVVLDMPETEEDVTIELEVTDLAGNANDYAADALVIPYAASFSCTTDSVDTTGSNDNGSTAQMLSSNATGQSFEVSAGYISAIEIYIAYAPAGTEGELRIGSSTDLSTYLAAKTFSEPEAGWLKVVFDSPVEVSASTTYYFGVAETAGDLRIQRDNDASYASGTIIYEGTGWALGSTGSVQDLRWRVYLCD